MELTSVYEARCAVYLSVGAIVRMQVTMTLIAYCLRGNGVYVIL